MMDAANLDGIGVGTDEEEAVVANAQTKLISALKRLHVARARFRKAMQSRKNVLKDFLKISQFIIITHNKRTIELADVMYGITMQERGVSKIVSVKFSDDKKKDGNRDVSGVVKEGKEEPVPQS